MTCKDCKDKSCLKTGRPCAKIELFLRSQGIKGSDWIRPRVSPKKAKDGYGKWREIPFSALKVDETGGKDPIMEDRETT